MAELFCYSQQDNFSIFKDFSALYGDRLSAYCNLLNKFKINILTIDEYNIALTTLPYVADIEKQPYASFIVKYGYAAETTKAGIVINTTHINNLQFTIDEQYAAIAHEIGHILYFFLDNKDMYPGQIGEEIYSDSIAARLSLAHEMISILSKLEESKMYMCYLHNIVERREILKSIQYTLL